ncbi:hypothetical protein GS610_20970 [Ruegeria sp. HKCCD6228]|uniref:Uncharacterized protein n=1 Tax=Ruegeria atlantica TaxID=81569 RepID=A0AA90Z5S5_9RHOB|nr:MULTISPECIES: hypothetical protein [Ruegeria]NOD32763.1 hypothetical protein [Ruegeria atlantica]NOD99688.1 hypothetical protein [Ruegeria sp. HKCCD6228]NOE20736.1 hypothetical protein [Ruegeria atlantica]
MKHLAFYAIVGAFASPLAAETLYLYEDTHDLPPPYKQWWSAIPEDKKYDEQTHRHVYVRGDGKYGDFFGVLYVDCINPEYSEWLAVGGSLNSEDVPNQAIVNLRLEICSNGEET